MRRCTGINLLRRSLRKLHSARRISIWRPAESVGGISSPWLILWTAWPERRRGLLRSGSRLFSPANGTVPTARWRASSRLGCPYIHCANDLHASAWQSVLGLEAQGPRRRHRSPCLCHLSEVVGGTPPDLARSCPPQAPHSRRLERVVEPSAG